MRHTPLACIAADRLKHGTPVSIGARSLRHDKLLAQDNILRHTLARLDELSILAPNELPYYPDARVTRIYEPKAKPVARTPKEPEGEVFYGGGLIHRYYKTEITVGGARSLARRGSPDWVRAQPDDGYSTTYDHEGNVLSRIRLYR
jgi:hypothetical protein